MNGSLGDMARRAQHFGLRARAPVAVMSPFCWSMETMSSGIFDATIRMAAHGLDLSLARQTALNANLANLDTPNYTPHDVDFQDALKEAMQTNRVDPQRMVERADKAPGVDGNSVDLDMQMARVSQNATFYQASSKAISRKLAMLRYVASEG